VTAALTVVGIDGAPLVAAAADAIAAAEVVVGAARHLAAVPVPDSAERVELGPVEPALERLGRRRAVVLASGDPGFFGIVRLLRERGPR
jgi:precorrin-6Y C5,15-methyltransferase (decarboxylating)